MTWGFWAFVKERTLKPSAKRVGGLLCITVPLAGWAYVVMRTNTYVEFGAGHIAVLTIGAGLVGASVMLEKKADKAEATSSANPEGKS